MKTSKERVTDARKRLLVERPFYGSLGMRLNVQVTADGCETAQTDGTNLTFNPDFVETLSNAELLGVTAHEILHCSLRHVYRVGSRDMDTANQAADYVTNDILIKEGFTLPDGALIDPSYSGMSFEQVFSILWGRKQQQGQGQPDNGTGTGQGNQQGQGQPTNGQGQPQSGQPCPTGSFGPPMQQPPSNGQEQGQPGTGQGQPEPMSEQDWEIATEQAAMIAAKAGKYGAALERGLKRSKEPAEDWRSILREFIEQTVPSDYSWTRPNRRHIANGIYLPGTVKENAPRFTVAVDTSGSISDEILGLFSAELESIMSDVKPDGMDVIYCDARINGTDAFEPDEPIKLRNIGGGGTRFSPVFDHIDEQPEQPSCLIYFTDLECSDAPTEPEYPVLWVTTESTSEVGLFGRTVRLSQWI